MANEKRMAGDYEITAAVSIGYKEVVIGVDENNTDGQKYMCAYGERNELFELFNNVLVSDSYPEIVEIFGKRVTEEAEKVRTEIEGLGIPLAIIRDTDCIPDNYQNDINGKIIAIDSKILKPEFQRADRQLYLVTGGFGAAANSRGSAVFCKNIYDGKTTRYERMDVIGEVKPECLPDWAKAKLREMNEPKKNRNKVRER